MNTSPATQAPTYSKYIANGAIQILWHHPSHLSTQTNELATKLVGSLVCGDAVAVGTSSDVLIDTLKHTANKPAVNHATTTTPPWCNLPGEILAHVVRIGGACSPTLTLTMMQVSPLWRSALLFETPLLQQLKFSHLTPPYQAMPSPSTPFHHANLPRLVSLAVDAGNIRASVLAGRLYLQWSSKGRAAGNYWKFRTTGNQDGTVVKKYWMKAGRSGHAEACWRLGIAHYRGEMGLEQDSEEAMVWLLRSVKALMMTPMSVPASVPDGKEHDEKGDDSSASDDNKCLVLMPGYLRQRALRECAHVLGILHLDGDVGVKQDTAVARKWLSIANENGCEEAGRILQSLFRSGQY